MITINGVLDESVWEQANRYNLNVSRDSDDERPKQSGYAMVAMDDEYLYIAIDFEDHDIVQSAEQDQKHHYRTGDTAEVFLKPSNQTYYWELYVTPNSRRTALFYPGRGRLGIVTEAEIAIDVRVAAQVDGTLND